MPTQGFTIITDPTRHPIPALTPRHEPVTFNDLPQSFFEESLIPALRAEDAMSSLPWVARRFHRAAVRSAASTHLTNIQRQVRLLGLQAAADTERPDAPASLGAKSSAKTVSAAARSLKRISQFLQMRGGAMGAQGSALGSTINLACAAELVRQSVHLALEAGLPACFCAPVAPAVQESIYALEDAFTEALRHAFGPWLVEERDAGQDATKISGRIINGVMNASRRLVLQSNDVRSLPALADYLPALTSLRIQMRQPIVLRGVLTGLDDLRELELTIHGLDALGLETATLTRAAKLKALRITAHQLGHLPDSIYALTALEILHILDSEAPYSNDLQVDGRIAKLRHLKELNLANNKLLKLPPEIWDLPNLESLNLRNNWLLQWPLGIGKAVQLKKLDVSGNRNIAAPPTDIGQLINLEYLDVTKTSWSALPLALGQLKALKVLLFGGYELQAWPAFVNQLPQLEELTVSNATNLRYVEDFSALTHLKKIVFASVPLQSFPGSICKIEGLTHVKLDNNGLTDIPTDIGRLINLEELILCNQPITKLPFELSCLEKLKVLDLSRTKLTGFPFPQSFCNLGALEKVDLTQSVAEIPSIFGLLPSLHTVIWKNFPQYGVRIPVKLLINRKILIQG